MKIHPFWKAAVITIIVGVMVAIIFITLSFKPTERIIEIGGDKMAFFEKDARIWSCGGDNSLELISLQLPSESGQRGVGTILIDNSNAGPETKHYRKGLEKVWTWDYAGKNEGYNYMVILKPSNTAFYYDFSNVKLGESTNPTASYSCKQTNP